MTQRDRTEDTNGLLYTEEKIMAVQKARQPFSCSSCVIIKKNGSTYKDMYMNQQYAQNSCD